MDYKTNKDEPAPPDPDPSYDSAHDLLYGQKLQCNQCNHANRR